MLSGMDYRSEKRHKSLITKVTENRASLQQSQRQMARVEEGMSKTAAVSSEQTEKIRNDIARSREDLSHKLDGLSLRTDDTQSSIMSFRRTGDQILEFFRSFPQGLRELLNKILQSNWQMYQILLQVQQNFARSLTGMLDSNIKFEDALGDHRELPYEIFRHWEVLKPRS